MDVHQLESAKRCFLRILSWPRLSPPVNCVDALRGMARYHKVRMDWVSVSKCSKEAITLLRETSQLDRMEPEFLGLLADAAEGQGNMQLAREYDEQAEEL